MGSPRLMFAALFCILGLAATAGPAVADRDDRQKGRSHRTERGSPDRGDEGAAGGTAGTEEGPGSKQESPQRKQESPQRKQESPQRKQESPAAASQAATLALVLTADDASIGVGETTTVRATVTNEGGTPIDGVTLTVALPDALDHVSSEPPASGDPASGLLDFALGSIAAGEQKVVGIVVEGKAQAHGASIEARAVAQDVDEAARLTIDVVAPEGLSVAARSRELLVQVGDTIHYSVRVANGAPVALQDVIVVALVPSEVDVTAAPVLDVVDAVQIGRSGDEEDIVWVISELPAGEVVNLPWAGRVDRPGELEAVTRVRATSSGGAARDSATTYLARVERPLVRNPVVEPIRRRITTFVKVPTEGDAGRSVSSALGSTLPLTGMNSALYVVLGMTSLWLGFLLALVGGRRARGRAGVLLVLVAALATGACSPEPRGTVTGPPTPEASPSDRVGGVRIERDDERDDPDPTATPDADADSPGVEDGPATGDLDLPPVPDEPAFRFETQVRTVTIEVADLPVRSLGSTTSDERTLYTWDASANKIVGSGSERTSAPDPLVAMTTSVSSASGAVRVTVQIENLADDHRLRVAGRILHEVTAGGRRIATLTSAPLDDLLVPGGLTTVSFTYALPGGSYGADASFAPAR